MYLDVLRLHWIWCHQFFKTRKAAQKAADAAEAKTLTLAQKKKIVAAAKK
jgi:ribosomal 50S subunit-recycling heat shock protein